MKMLRLVYVLLLVFTIIGFSESIVYPEYHHADVENCTVCHAAHEETSNLKMIKEVITTPKSGDKDVLFTAPTGTNSFADGDGTYDGVCEVCHTLTNHHTNVGHPSLHHAGEDCISCHKHNNEFKFVPSQ